MLLHRSTLLATLLVASATSLAAQGRIGCASGNPVATLGTLDLECVQCTIHTDADRWIEYSVEPTVKRVESGSDGLRSGDVIVSIDGVLITTAAGSRRLANPNPDQPSNVTIRRDGKQLMLSIAPQLRCPVNVVVHGGPADRVYVARRITDDKNSSRQAWERFARAMTDSVHIGVGVALTSGWLGFGIECGHCSLRTDITGRSLWDFTGRSLWDFSEAPSVFGVEPNSPAALAGLEVGDVIRAIDGMALTTATGAQRFSNIRPGQKVAITIERGGKSRVIQMTAGKRHVET
jgi:S1-C subfamily serine protease